MPGSSEASLTSPPALVSSYKETANRALAHFRAELEDGKWIQLETNDVLTGVSVFKKKKRDRGSALSSSSPSPSPSSSHSSLLSACTSSSSSSEESFKTVSMYMGVGVVEDVSPEMIIGRKSLLFAVFGQSNSTFQ